MANEIVDVEIEETEDEPDEPEQPEAPVPEIPKVPETPQAKKARLERQLKRVNKELGVDDEPTAPTAPIKTSDLDYGQKAYLKAYGIAGSDELALVKDYAKRTGDDLDTIVSDDIFLAKLGKLREAKAAADAVPKGKGRSQSVTSNDVDYWKGKIEAGQATLNDIPDVKIRRQVLNARIENERTGHQFSDQSVQMG